MFTEESKKYLGAAMKIAVPIMIQNGITNFVNLLDNIMVGRLGTDPMSAVAIVNQLIFVFNLTVFGALSGICIFTAQYHGREDNDGVRYTFRLMLWTTLAVTAVGAIILSVFRDPLIGMFLTDDGGAASAAETLRYAQTYIGVMLFVLAPFALTQDYASLLRTAGDTVSPMRAGLLAMLANLCGNYVLIYGKFGFPAMGVAGAAVATAAARILELTYLLVYTKRHRENYPYLDGAWSSLYVPLKLTVECIRKGTPLLLNEFLWSLGNAATVQLYSTLGLSIVAAFNISSTISNVFNVVFISMGSAVGILIGRQLGAGKTDTVLHNALLLTKFTVVLCAMVGAVLFVSAPLFPRFYNTSDEIRSLACQLIRTSAVFMPVYACCNSEYFILRSGGKTLITFVFDSIFSWTVVLPLLWVLLHYMPMPPAMLYACVQSADLIKLISGLVLVKKGVWIHNIIQGISTGG